MINDSLEKVIDTNFKKVFEPKFIIQILIEEFLKSKNIKFTDEYLTSAIKLEEDVLKLNFDITKNQLNHTDCISQTQLDLALKDFSNDLNDRLNLGYKELEKDIPNIQKSFLDGCSNSITKSMFKNVSQLISVNNRDRTEIQKNVFLPNMLELQILEMVVKIISERLIESNGDVIKNNPKNEVFIRLLGESSLVANEILILLNNGFPDGAMARWRSLHEQSVVANFLTGESDNMSKKYLDHSAVDDYKSMNMYRKYVDRLQHAHLSEEENKFTEQEYNKVMHKYGNTFKNDYGWASDFFDKANPRFADIEKEVGLDHLRPYYKLSCSRVHFSAKGMMYKLGNVANADGLPILYGQSASGFSEPINITVLSLVRIYSAYMLFTRKKSDIVSCMVLTNLYNELNKIN